ncbi:MAG: ABC transporter substrate-binding protein [Actinobacteria bacterium]|nr:ABC transporter substrate-binding protein [Actinomycetota bacterium]
MRGRRRGTRTATALAALSAFVALAVACGDAGDSASGTSAPVRGGTLTVAFQGEPATLDPAIAWEIESWCIERLTYQTFLTYASRPGKAGTRLVPDLATEVPSRENGGISADGKVYTFRLRKGVRFAPPVGREVKAADFKWSFERMMGNPKAPARRFYMGIAGARAFVDGQSDEISGYEVIDDATVRITLERPDAAFLMAMTMPFTSVMPKEWVEKVGESIGRRPLGTGPYVVSEWRPDQSLTAVRNEYWTGDDDQWVDEMRFDFTGTPGTALSKLEAGDVDVLGDGIAAADHRRVADDPTLRDAVVSAPQIAWYYVFMNVLEEPFTDARVRRAVSHAVDKEKIRKLLAGQGEILGQLYPKGMPGHQAGASFYEYDPGQARRLLAEAGYPDGFTVRFFTHGVDPFPALAESIRADLEAAGVRTDLEQLPRDRYWDVIGRRDSHAAMGLGDWYQDFPDPSGWIRPLFTDPVDGGVNASFYRNAEVDALVAQAASELDEARRVGLFEQMQELIMADAPVVPLCQPVWNGLHGKTTGGVYVHPVWVHTFQEYWKTGGE